MKVVLLNHTPEPQVLAALAARLCYSASDLEALKEKLSESDTDDFINMIMNLGHTSVLEHASFTFGVEGISRVTSHQLVRHRVASYSQQSQRYVKGPFGMVIPPSIARDTFAWDTFQHAIKQVEDAYECLIARGIPAEDARYLLPNATETKILVTMNARELLHFFSVRCCERAQWEIREMATRMLGLVRPAAPTIFAKAGPSCVRGACSEGAKGCGRSREAEHG